MEFLKINSLEKWHADYLPEAFEEAKQLIEQAEKVILDLYKILLYNTINRQGVGNKMDL